MNRRAYKGHLNVNAIRFLVKDNSFSLLSHFFFFFLDQLNQPFVHMPVIPSQTVIPGFTRITGFEFCTFKKASDVLLAENETLPFT